MKEDSDKRMVDLVKKLEEIHEIYKYNKTEYLDESILNKHADRFKKMIQKEVSYMPSNDPIMGAGKTVNSIVDNGFEPITNKGYQNKLAYSQGVVANPTLTPKEAFELSIRRTLESGRPINEIGFYEEVNWNIQKLGFNSKNELDIKNAINDLVQYGYIKN